MDLISATEVEAITDSNANAGNFGLMVLTNSGQGAVSSGFTFNGTSSPATASGGGGGGCSADFEREGPFDLSGEIPGWAVLFFGWWGIRRRLRKRPVPVRISVE